MICSPRSESEVRRRAQREERRGRLENQVSSMKTRDRSHQEQLEKTSSEMSISWLVLGFAVVVGYCVYYLYSR